MAENTNLVAARDGILLRVGNEIRSMYKDGAVPQGADPDHVKVLVERGLLVKPADTADTDVDTSGPPAKSAPKADWVAYAVTQGADEAEAVATTKDDLIATYGGS